LLIPQIIGENPLNIEHIMRKLDVWLNDGGSFAKAAVDMALYDLAGKLAALPAYDFMGGKVWDSLPICYVITWGTKTEVVEEARKWAAKGIRSFKVKIGHKDPNEDAKNLAAVRGAVGKSVKLRIDANQGYRADWQ
jgi:L-alanine-DL-glutamate epimerase-like enolase superfamily enzyme